MEQEQNVKNGKRSYLISQVVPLRVLALAIGDYYIKSS